MKKLQKRDVVSIIIHDWLNLVSVCIAENPDVPFVEIVFSRLVIEDDKMTIEGTRGSGPIFASLSKISNGRWVVDEAIY